MLVIRARSIIWLFGLQPRAPWIQEPPAKSKLRQHESDDALNHVVSSVDGEISSKGFSGLFLIIVSKVAIMARLKCEEKRYQTSPSPDRGGAKLFFSVFKSVL
ncbi:hypothetical protein EVAR_17028_1 [Eumeta japonica]|uniref:Uncharacterized protein n=1 Tax=Eumeta variegata TaxID=151549 RepID=A0A4C1V607_EUMVA|nr:hypothetical protein EVAR_17028_1 [Eumeta japonica]